MDISEQIEKRVKLDKVNHEITSLNKKYETNVEGRRITDPEDRIKLDRLLKMKEELVLFWQCFFTCVVKDPLSTTS